MKLDIPEGPFEAYIFDCDGTLADSMPVHYDAFLKTFAQMGVEFDLTEEIYYGLAGVPIHEFVANLNHRFNTQIDSHEVD